MKTYERLFEQLYETKDFVTGEALAKQLGISRTAVWKGMQKLSDMGLEIEAIKNRGYRWQSGDILLPHRISQALGLPVSYQPVSTSTQLDAKQGIEARRDSPCLYLANHQLEAKGRFGRPFYAEPNGGIYMSLHLKPNKPLADLPPYTLMVAASLIKTISRATDLDPEIKWVNDIYLDGKKVAGILTEAISSVETGLVTDVIIGVGINMQIRQFPKALGQKAGSLFHDQPPISRNQLICDMWQLFLTIPEADLVKVYRDKSLVLGKEVSFSQDGKTYTGLALDVTKTGELVVELADGQQKSLKSGEVSLTSWEKTED